MLLAKIKLKLRKAKRKGQRPSPVNIKKLKDPEVKRVFQKGAKNMLAVLAEHPEEVDMQSFNGVLVETGRELLGPRRRRKDEWISDSTLKKVDSRTEKKKILSTKYERVKTKGREQRVG